MNDISGAMKAHYRMLLVCVMLREAKVKGKTAKPHDYPQMILTNLLILEYWRSIGYVGWQMICRNTSIVNEELGEGYFSILSRSVLGDTTTSHFEHLSKMYSLLPIYRDVKNDISYDNGTAKTISGRHNIDPEGEVVLSVAHFFTGMIRRLGNRRYRAYDGSTKSYKNAEGGSKHITSEVNPRVYDPDVLQLIPNMFATISDKLHNSAFLQEHGDIWSEVHNPGGDVNQPPVDMQSDGELTGEVTGEEDSVVYNYVNAWHHCVIGHYAVTRAEWEEGSNGTPKSGICVYRVLSIDEDDIKDGDLTYNSFQGAELFCTKGQHSPRCVGAQWHLPRQRKDKVISQVLSYEVVLYFEGLTQNKLPTIVVDELQVAARTERIFSE